MIVNKKIILASKSPRRQELIKGLEIPFEIVSYEVDESFDDTLTKHEIPLYLAQKKGEAFLYFTYKRDDGKIEKEKYSKVVVME
jgi:septum formation protein